MNKIIAAAVFATMLASGAQTALAQPGPPGQQHDNGHSGPPGQQHDNGHPGPPGHGPSGHDGKGPPNHYDDHGHGAPHGKPPHHDVHEVYRPDPPPQHWKKGERVPQPYRGHQYVINDWRPYHLPQPQRGYQWIGVGADFFQVNIGSGIVLQAVIGN